MRTTFKTIFMFDKRFVTFGDIVYFRPEKSFWTVTSREKYFKEFDEHFDNNWRKGDFSIPVESYNGLIDGLPRGHTYLQDKTTLVIGTQNL